jgi:hypothetical protein
MYQQLPENKMAAEITISRHLYQMNRDLVGSIYGRSSIKIAHFVPITNQKQESPVVAMFVNGSEQNVQSS